MKNLNLKKNQTKSNTLATLSAVLVVIMIITTGVSFFMLTKRIDELKGMTVVENLDTYDKYVCMVTSDDESDFWQEVYAVAKNEGESKGVYVEMLSDSLNTKMSSLELLNIAIAAHPDGIILQADTTAEMTELLAKADEAEIPVVTVLSDGDESHRISYVSVNNYTLGQRYGSQVLSVAENDSSVLILTRLATSNAVENIITTGIQDTILSSDDHRDINITTSAIVDEDAFAIEESVRNIFMSSEELPDVIICLDEQITTCVYQAMIDYNKVGQVQLLGYYDSDTILEGIRQGVIHSTVTVDTETMGADCVDAFLEYWENGYVSEFYDVDSKLIVIENIDQMVKGDEHETN